MRKVTIRRHGDRWKITRAGYGLTTADITYRDTWSEALAVATRQPTQEEDTRGTSYGLYGLAGRPQLCPYPARRLMPAIIRGECK